jgi:hypothetical protein
MIFFFPNDLDGVPFESNVQIIVNMVSKWYTFAVNQCGGFDVPAAPNWQLCSWVMMVCICLLKENHFKTGNAVKFELTDLKVGYIFWKSALILMTGVELGAFKSDHHITNSLTVSVQDGETCIVGEKENALGIWNVVEHILEMLLLIFMTPSLFVMTMLLLVMPIIHDIAAS